ncbi:MAG: T9SS type A sorting domain-containing protein, partial [Flavobacteriales bacterium]
SIPSGDVYTDAARALYGTSHEVSFGETETVNTAEGLYPIVLPLAAYLSNQASPWEWWDPMSPLATTVVGMIGDTPITAHMASLGSNPDMSEAKGLSYLDTIQGYLLPRVMCALDLEGAACSTEDSVNEIKENNSLVVYPNPASDVVFLEGEENILSVAVYDITGKLVDSLVGKSGNRLEVSMTGYTPGYYSFQVRTASGISTERVIKK